MSGSELTEALGALRGELDGELVVLLPPEDSIEAWLHVLGDEVGELIGRLPERVRDAAVEALVVCGGTGGAALSRAAEAATGKAERRRYRVALHRLRSGGVRIEESSKVKASRVSQRSGAQPEPERALASPIDPTGTRVLILERPHRGRSRVYELVLNDRDGVLRLEGLDLRRREARELSRRMIEQKELRLAPIPAPGLRRLVQRAEKARSGAGAPGVDPSLVTDLLAGEIGPTPGDDVRERLASSGGTESEADRVLRERVERGDLPQWAPLPDVILDAARRIGSADQSPLVLSPVQSRERHQEAVVEEARTLIDAEIRGHFAARLDETAYLWEANGDEAGAAAAISAAVRIRDPDRLPLSIDYLERAFSHALEAARRVLQSQDEKGKLIT